MKKAFTLIELIATIVILGVVTSIVSILIMNVIRNVKDSARKRSIDNYGRIIETSMAEYQSQYLKYPDSIDQLEIEYVGSVIECETRRINPDKTIYLSECKVNGKKVLDKSTEDGYYHYGKLVLTDEEYVDKLGKNIEVALKDYYKENNKYPVNYRLLNLSKLDKDVNCVSEIHHDGTVYLTKCSIDGSYITDENEEDGYYHYGKTMYDYFDNDGNGYIEVEYLESTGTQYIDMGLTLSNNSKIELTYSLMSYGAIFGTQQNGSGFTININNEANSRWGNYSYVPYSDVNFDKDFQETHNIVYGKEGFYQDGVLLNTPAINTFETSNNGYLFRANGASGISHVRIYSAKLYDNDVLIRDYVPTLDNQMTPCLFDKIEKKCYHNQGVGEFVFPSETGEHYLDYLESTGTQYIDMGLTLSNNSKIELTYSLMSYGAIFGTQQNGSGFTININNEANSRWGNYSYVPYSDVNFDKDFQETHNIVYGKEGFYQDGVLLNTPAINTFETSNNGYLFRANGASGISHVRIYSAKLYDNDVLIRDYVPKIDNENRPCLFDMVEKKCYYNQGTGEFLYG